MNIQRLEMMKQMLGRVVAGSWEPVSSIPANERLTTEIQTLSIVSVDLNSWSELKTRYPKNTCGFSACAVGHACFDEEFRKLGWSWEGNIPVFDKLIGWYAVEKFFDIYERTAESLFMSQMYDSAHRSKYQHIPKNIREAQMVHDRIDLLIQYANENKFNRQVRGLMQ